MPQASKISSPAMFANAMLAFINMKENGTAANRNSIATAATERVRLIQPPEDPVLLQYAEYSPVH